MLHEEVAHERDKETDMDKVYAELREKRFSFEETAEGNLEQMNFVEVIEQVVQLASHTARK